MPPDFSVLTSIGIAFAVTWLDGCILSIVNCSTRVGKLPPIRVSAAAASLTQSVRKMMLVML